jgi:hypothetical protein
MRHADFVAGRHAEQQFLQFVQARIKHKRSRHEQRLLLMVNDHRKRYAAGLSETVRACGALASDSLHGGEKNLPAADVRTGF